MDQLIMNRKEREQLNMLKQIKDGQITQSVAAKRLNMSARGLRKKQRRYEKEGDAGIVHKNRGKISPRRWNEEEKKIALDLLKSDWRGFGPTFAAEKLKEWHGIKISHEALRKTMAKERLWFPKEQKIKHRQWRERKEFFGELIQLDGSPHDWLEGRAPKFTLLVFIDDATSKILHLEFAKSESFKGVAGAAKNYMSKFGRPLAFYVDFGGVFSVNLNNPDRDKKTQFERVMRELSVGVKHATSPQAKGRVERANKTLQDRLVKEMRLKNICSMKDANKYLQESNFVEKHNLQFAVEANKKGDVHRSVENYDLDGIFFSKLERVITNDFTVQYKSKLIQLEEHQPTIIRPKNSVTICESLDGILSVFIRDLKLNFKDITMRKPRKLSPVEFVNQCPDFPILGNLENVVTQTNVGSENRNFSCC